MMLVLVLLLSILIGGGLASFFASRRLPKTALILAIVTILAGYCVADFAAVNILRTEHQIVSREERGDFGNYPHPEFDMINRWVNPYLLVVAGISLGVFGLGACLGCGIRKLGHMTIEAKHEHLA